MSRFDEAIEQARIAQDLTLEDVERMKDSIKETAQFVVDANVKTFKRAIEQINDDLREHGLQAYRKAPAQWGVQKIPAGGLN